MKLTLKEIQKHSNLEKHSLELIGCSIDDSDVFLICEYLKENPNITSLNVSFNTISADGAKVLATNTTIKMLNISGNDIGAAGAKALAANSALTTLNVSWNYIEVKGARALANNNTIRMLNVRDNSIGDQGAKALAANSALTTLDISTNLIGTSGARSFAANTTITSLNIENNLIGASGAKALVANNTLLTLNITNNNIGEAGAKVVVRKLKNNTVLKNLSHSLEGKLARRMIVKILNRNKMMPWLRTINNAHLMAQAQRSENCPLGTLPIEVLGLINDYAVGTNHFSFFVSQFNKRPAARDFTAVKKMALS